MSEKAHLPDPHSAPELFEGVLFRRVVAYLIDLFIICVVGGVLTLLAIIAGFLTLGVGWLAVPIAGPIAVLIYYAVTLGSHRRATPGMSVMDIVLTPTRQPLNGWHAILHPLVFWITIWVAWPLLAIAFFTPRRELLHDFIVGALMLRRSPMESHWSSVGPMPNKAA